MMRIENLRRRTTCVESERFQLPDDASTDGRARRPTRLSDGAVRMSSPSYGSAHVIRCADSLLPTRIGRFRASWFADGRFARNEIPLPRFPLPLDVVRPWRRCLRVVRKRLTVRMLVFAFSVLIDVVLGVLSGHEEQRRKARAHNRRRVTSSSAGVPVPSTAVW